MLTFSAMQERLEKSGLSIFTLRVNKTVNYFMHSSKTASDWQNDAASIMMEMVPIMRGSGGNVDAAYNHFVTLLFEEGYLEVGDVAKSSFTAGFVRDAKKYRGVVDGTCYVMDVRHLTGKTKKEKKQC